MEVLNNYQREKLDEGNDEEFYSDPKFVYHLDANFRQNLSDLYDKEIDDTILSYRKSYVNLEQSLDFVAIKNGGHSEKGWLFTNKSKTKLKRPKIWEVHKEIS